MPHRAFFDRKTTYINEDITFIMTLDRSKVPYSKPDKTKQLLGYTGSHKLCGQLQRIIWPVYLRAGVTKILSVSYIVLTKSALVGLPSTPAWNR